MARRVTSEGGFGLVELLIAMVVMVVGISALVAAYSSGMVALNRANQTGTAGTLADKQMEAYRALPFSSVWLTGDTPSPALDLTYSAGDPASGALITAPPASCAPTTPTCMPIRTKASGLTAPDGGNYRLDTYISWSCPLGDTLTTSAPYGTPAAPGCLTAGALTARAVKKVTVVVRDGANPAKVYMRESSTFDQAT
jgi:type II secretory pathway pseudopilin PulG